jgi:hypothetical protein
MLKRAEECETYADKARDPATSFMLRETAHQLRTVAVHLDMLEREPFYRRVRDRLE